MTLFGRDSLWAGWMALPCGNQLLLGVMRTLARLQGRNLVFDTEENPGRILHEVRTGKSGSDAIDDADIYYGSTDVTPLFVIMAGELLRWGASPRGSRRSASRGRPRHPLDRAVRRPDR